MEFRPDYIALAREMIGRHPMVEFYAVSCEAHQDICNDQHMLKAGLAVVKMNVDVEFSDRTISRAVAVGQFLNSCRKEFGR